jgi:hypothetical protein
MSQHTEDYVQVANRVPSKELFAVELCLQEREVLLRLLDEALLRLALRPQRQP